MCLFQSHTCIWSREKFGKVKKFGAGDYPTFGSCFTLSEAHLSVLCRGIEQWLDKQETARNLKK